MHDTINEYIFEFAITCQQMIERGWKFIDIEYGDRRFGIGVSLTIKKGDKEIKIYSPYEMEDILRKENDV